MNTKLLLMASTASLLLFNACEGGTTFMKDVRNQSSETMTLEVFYKSTDLSADTFAIAPGTTKNIFYIDLLGVFVGDGYYCSSELDSVHVTVSNGKTLVKDLLNTDNWERESKDGRNSRETCTFTISDADLQ